MTNFWLQFIVSESIAAAQAFVQTSGLTAAQKTALEQFIQAGQAVAASFGV